MDRVSKSVRSKIMSSVKTKNTAPELAVRKLLFSKGFRYRLHVRNLPGSPDIYLKKYKTAIFVHGCFWHQHPKCKRATVPESNLQYWVPKLKNNIIRDKKKLKALSEMPLEVIVVWECETKNEKRLLKKLGPLLSRGANEQ
jgi:DNA mismatch endonuclease, patch repair protein